MGKHKAKFWERPAAYVPWAVDEARDVFLENVRKARLTGDWSAAHGSRVRGRVETQVRVWSDHLGLQRVVKRWW